MALLRGAGVPRVRILMVGALACIGMPATAQDDQTDDSDIEVVVVTAKFQRSLASAITQKQLADDGVFGEAVVPAGFNIAAAGSSKTGAACSAPCSGRQTRSKHTPTF